MDEQLIRLYQFVLNLDYFEQVLVEEQEVRNIEMDAEADKAIVPSTQQFKEIPTSFESVYEYIEIWEPLFFVECQANIYKTIQTEGVDQIPCKIGLIERQPTFLRMQIQTDFELKINAHDLILISCEQVNIKKPLQSYTPHLVGIVESSGNSIRCFVEFDDKSARGTRFIAGFKDCMKNQGFWIGKLCGMTTIEREFKALQHLPKLYLSPNILHPGTLLAQDHSYFEIPDMLKTQLEVKFNPSQLSAIGETLKEEGITLIQGPPGTGKTMTVIGTVSVLLQSFQADTRKGVTNLMELEGLDIAPDTFQQRSPWTRGHYEDWRDQIFDDVIEDINKYFGFETYLKAQSTDRVKILSRRAQAELVPEKILVCGPSNASVDEIIIKVLHIGLLDQHGKIYHPAIVRIGENFDPQVAHVSLDQLVKQKMFEQQLLDDQDGAIKHSIIKQAKIVFGTLSSAGSHLLTQGKHVFDTVIVDEAAQAVEISTLIPLQYGCKRLILIGDPNQLPATVFSKTSERNKYTLSLFERLQRNKVPVHLLNTQYRMHPQISKFISSTFYKSELIDGANLMQLIGKPKIYNYYAFSPLVVFHVKGYEEKFRQSYKNEAESQVVTELLMDLLKKYPQCDLSSVGVISAYTGQISTLQRSLRKALNTSDLPIEVKTVDGFQGREKDIIIFSTVRSSFTAPNEINKSKSIGFLKDARRMNVSLSRCRQSLIVVCDINKLKHNKLWKSLVEYSFSLGTCYKVDPRKPAAEWFQEFDANPIGYKLKEYREKARPKPMQQEPAENIVS